MNTEQAAPDFTGDEHWGKGGRYIVVDGKRTPAPAEQPEQADPAEAPAPAETQPAKKGK